jgi:hypothetical protein
MQVTASHALLSLLLRVGRRRLQPQNGCVNRFTYLDADESIGQPESR